MKISLSRMMAVLAAWMISLYACAQVSTVPVKSLPQNAKLAICGDSITEQMLYTKYVEIYLRACAGRNDVSVFQFGWGGENADQFSNRIKRGDLDAFVPTAVTFLYGANDGGGMTWADWVGTMWTGRVNNALSNLNSKYPSAASYTVICSPTYFDQRSDGQYVDSIASSNSMMSHFRDIDLSIAQNSKKGFADIRQRMLETCTAAKAVLGASYLIGGTDGVHAGPNGHLMIAHEVLRALNCDGAIGTINVNMSGAATASAGHTVVSFSNGTVTLDSTRYPFCSNYDNSTAADRMGTILPYLPFSQNLNRFVLVVSNLGAANANVTWGGATKTFTSAELSAGVNLADKFEKTPFDAAFAKIMGLIEKKQIKERDMIKAAGDATAAVKGWTDADVAARNSMDADVRNSITAVRHAITIVPVGGTVAPVISVAGAASGTVGAAFSYQITAANSPASYNATNLPAGLGINTASGLISGTPTKEGTSNVTLSAANSAGTGTAVLTIGISAATPVPVISSATTASGTVGTAFSYQIKASNAPTKFYATGLPAGLSVNSATGAISGTPSAPGTTNVLISAENAGGNGPAVTLVITVTSAAPPAFSLTVASGSGGGTYEQGAIVQVSANSAGAGQVFDKWTGDVDHIASASSATTNVTIPDHAVSISATYKSSGSATSGIIVSDDFNCTDPWYWKYMAARTPATDLPGGKWIYESGDGDYEAFVQGSSANSANPNMAIFHFAASTGISIASQGTYVKPSNLTISADLKFQSGACQYVLLGFYPGINNRSYNPLSNFTGLKLNVDGSLSLVQNGIAGTTVAWKGSTFSPATFRNLSYSVNTSTGAISNVVLAGSSTTYNFTSTAFADAVTMYAGIGGAGGQYESVFIDNFAVSGAGAAAPPATYVLTVSSGTGSGSYAQGAVVSITANSAAAGQVFDKWTGDIDHVSSAISANANVTMPDHAVSLTSTYKSSGVATSAVIISDDFNCTDPWYWKYMAARTPATDLPGGRWIYESGDGDYEAFVQGSSANSANPDMAIFHFAASTGISIASQGTYVKPSNLTISADLKFGDSTCQYVLLGFYSGLNSRSFNPAGSFTGLKLNVDGSLSLVQNGIVGTAVAWSGSAFSPTTFRNLSYAVNTSTGAISNVVLAGSGSSYSFKSTAFTDGATSYAGIGGAGSQYGSVMVDNFAVSGISSSSVMQTASSASMATSAQKVSAMVMSSPVSAAGQVANSTIAGQLSETVYGIVLLEVPENNQDIPYTAHFKGRVIDISGQKGVPGVTVQVRDPVGGKSIQVPGQSDKDGYFSYSQVITADGEHTFDFFFDKIPDPTRLTASHTVAMKCPSPDPSGSFDAATYLAMESAGLSADDVLGMQRYFELRNGWAAGKITRTYKDMWISNTAASRDEIADVNFSSGLNLVLYGVEGGSAGNTHLVGPAMSTVPLVVHVSPAREALVIQNLFENGILDEAQKFSLLTGKTGTVKIAVVAKSNEETDGDYDIHLSAADQMEILANIAEGRAVSIESEIYSDIAVRALSVDTESLMKLEIAVVSHVK